MKSDFFGRRHLLKAVGSSLVIPAFLKRALAQDGPPPPRLIVIMIPNGVHQATFWPNATFTGSPTLDPILRDPVLRPRTTVIKGIQVTTGGSGTGHDVGWAGLWTGVRNVNEYAGGASIDQVLKRHLKFNEPTPTINCGVLAERATYKLPNRTSFSFTGPKQMIPTQVDPYKLYATHLNGAPTSKPADPTAAMAEAQRRLRQNRSVLDYASADLSVLRSRLGAAEREKLDIHATALRELESLLSAGVAGPSGAACSNAMKPMPGVNFGNQDNAPHALQAMFQFVASALACRATRIVTFPIGTSGDKWYFRFLGVNRNGHQDLAHADNGSDATITALRTKIMRWHAEQVATFAKLLDRFPEGNGSLLDNSLLIWSNENGTGGHSLSNVPIVMLGKAAGRLKKTGYLVDGGTQDSRKMNVTVMNLMGHPATGMGDQPNCGPLTGVG